METTRVPKLTASSCIRCFAIAWSPSRRRGGTLAERVTARRLLERAMRITLEVDKCIGSGSCEMLAPEVFEVGEDGLAELLDATPGSEMESKCRSAEESCPTQAITVEV